MKITVYKTPEAGITRDYDLTVGTARDIEAALAEHCELAEVDPARAAITIPPKEYSRHEYVVKCAAARMGLAQAAEEILRLQRRGYGETHDTPPQGLCTAKARPSPFANGFSHFCTECNVFFSVRAADAIGTAAFCPYCGKEDPLASTGELLAYCDHELTDPVNFHGAFPPDEPIPQSRTGATPRQVEEIVSLVALRRRHRHPVTVESIAGPSAAHRDITGKVFEELHITETGGAAWTQ